MMCTDSSADPEKIQREYKRTENEQKYTTNRGHKHTETDKKGQHMAERHKNRQNQTEMDINMQKRTAIHRNGQKMYRKGGKSTDYQISE